MPKRDGFGIGWLQVAICFALLVCVAMITSVYSIVAAPLDAEFHPPRFVLMLAMTIMSAVTALISPVLGNLMDRTSLRRMMVIGGLTVAAGYAMLSLVTEFWQVLVIFGLLIAPANVLIGPIAVTVLISRWFVKRRGTAIGIALAGISTGSVVFPPIVHHLLETFEWRQAYLVLSLILLVGTVGPALLVVNRPSDRSLNPDGALEAPVEAQHGGTRAEPISAWAVLSDPSFWMFGAVLAVATSGMAGMITNLAQVVLDQGLPIGKAALLITLYGATGFASKAFFAVLSDRVAPRVLLLASLGGFGAGMACLSQAHLGMEMFVLGVSLIGLFGGLMVPLKSLLVPRIFGEQTVGKAMGLMSVISLVAMLSTPPLFGGIHDLTGSYEAMFWAEAIVAALVMLLVPYIRLHPRGKVSAAAFS